MRRTIGTVTSLASSSSLLQPALNSRKLPE